jgi:Carboxypeptidase regulatory-like domain
MQPILRKTKSVIWFALVGALAAFPQTPSSISGRVIDLNGNPVAGAKVEAGAVGEGVPVSTTTSADGRYTLALLPSGKYDITSTMTGFQPFKQGGILVASSGVTVDIRMADSQLNTLGDGREFFAFEAAQRRKATGPTPRLPNGKPDLTGLWYGQATVDSGKLLLTPSAAAIKKERDLTEGKEGPQSYCLPMGITEMNRFDVWQVVQTPAVLAIVSSVDNPGSRIIYTDGRPRPKDYGPTWYGRSVGYWEGDTLVIDTIGFNDKSWLASNGPHSEKLHAIERYRRPDLGHLEIELTLEDSEAFQQPWVIRKTAGLAQDQQMMEYICNENERDRPHMVGK